MIPKIQFSTTLSTYSPIGQMARAPLRENQSDQISSLGSECSSYFTAVKDFIVSCFRYIFCCDKNQNNVPPPESEEIVFLERQFHNFQDVLHSPGLTNVDINTQLELLPEENRRAICMRFFQRLIDDGIDFPRLAQLAIPDFTRTYLRDPRWFAIFREESNAYILEQLP